MNIHITYALLAVFATILIAPAYGQGASPITISTDSDTYDHESKIFVTGSVDAIRSGIPVTYKVTSPINSIVTVGQNNVNDDGTFAFMLNTKGDTWKYDGEYVIRVQYGNPDVNNWAIVNLVGGVMAENTVTPPESTRITECSENAIAVADKCVPYMLTSGELISTVVDEKSIVLHVHTEDGPGSLELSELQSVLLDTHTILVDGQQWDDVVIDENTVMVMYPAGTTEISVYAAKVIPEFGTIAVIILAIAITSVLAVTAKTRLGIQPRI